MKGWGRRKAYTNDVSNITRLLVANLPAIAAFLETVECERFERTCDRADEEFADFRGAPFHA